MSLRTGTSRSHGSRCAALIAARAAVIGSLLLVGIVSRPPIPHAIQVTPATAVLALALARSASVHFANTGEAALHVVPAGADDMVHTVVARLVRRRAGAKGLLPSDRSRRATTKSAAATSQRATPCG
ncbi:MAG TPA: hypothetical protein VFD82_04570 [Planctomycetota bacterium]|nr:hypothetical protein [Planctomycetota bacterium]